MFKKDEYIVTLEGNFTVGNYQSPIARKNYCVKQQENSEKLYIYQGINGSSLKSNYLFTFDKSKQLRDWRYATPEEAKEYERLGEPYDVTTLDKFRLPEKWCVKDTADDRSKELYDYATKYGAFPPYFATKNIIYYHFPKVGECTTSDKIEEDYTEITYSQFLKYVLNQNEIKEDMEYLIPFINQLNE